MIKYWIYLVLSMLCFLMSCGNAQNKKEADLYKSKDENTIEKKGANIENSLEPEIIIYENSIGDIRLPFDRKEMLKELKENFKNMQIRKEMGQQDGPDFPLYSLLKEGREVCFFSMDAMDTLLLNQVYVNDSYIKDEYGLSVGDSYRDIRKLRKGVVSTEIDYHQHIYVGIEGSNILYEISSESDAMDTVDINTINLTDEFLKDWRIEYVIWKERD